MRNIIDDIERLDRLLMKHICADIVNGTLLEADDMTLELLLMGIWENLEDFQARGVVVGEA
tara:strand:+ start:206 stop:388 length:183 start_codon:yes stop_codon:yes gene_type:complete